MRKATSKRPTITVWKWQRSAARLYNELLDRIRILADQPLLGHAEPLLEDSAIPYRSLILQREFKVVYRIDNETIVVAAIHNCRQNPVKLREMVMKELS